MQLIKFADVIVVKQYCMKFTVTLIIGFFICSLVSGQNNYWFQQYGSRSSLMGGAVVGGVRDNSAIYYNPAGISFIDSTTLNVSANAYGIDYVNLKNGAGTNLDLTSLRFLIYPQFISGLVKFKFIPKLKFAYCLLTRYRSEIKMHADNTLPSYPIISDPYDSTQYYYGTFDYELSSTTQWGGFAFAYKVNKVFGVGLTTFISYSHYDGFRKTFASADVNNPDPDSVYMARFNSYESNNVDHFGLLWKVGFEFNWEKFKLGIAITTPQISLFGFSRIGRTLEYNNQDKFLNDSLPIGRFPSWLVSDDRGNLSTTMKSPFSLSIGAEWDFPKTNTKVTATIESFLPIQQYQIAKSDAPVYVRPTDQYNNAVYKQPFMELNSSSSAILNFGIGLEQKVGKRTSMYLGARTDWNSGYQIANNKTIITNRLNQSYNNYIHFSGGITLRKGSSDISFGLNYGVGTTVFKQQLVNLTEPEISITPDGDYLALQGPTQNLINSNVHSISFIIGYSYYVKR